MKKQFIHGTVIKLTREDTLADIERNFKKMKDSGLDTAVIWPSFFWWEEKKEGYPFNTGRSLLEIAERVGLKIIMELSGQVTAMEYAPDFLMKEEYYRKDRNGNKILPVSCYGFLNYFHPELDALICSQFKAAASAYKDYPALSGYDVFNETAFDSYDEYTIAAFREWLEKKYVTIENLDRVWERTYTDFSQVDYAPWTWMSIVPAADFGAFRRESVGMHLRRWCAAIREVDAEHVLIADNIGSMVTGGVAMYERPQDETVLRDSVDVVGTSFYPKQVLGTQPEYMRWCALDSLYTTTGRRGFYISEMQTHIQAMFNPTTAVRKHELKQWCYESLAAGAKSLIYWMWRPFTKGLQTSGRGLVDYLERSTPRLEFVKEFSELLRDTGALRPVGCNVGILYDSACLDFQVLYTKSYGSVDQNIYSASVTGAYKALYDAGIKAEVTELADIKKYKLLVLTNHIIVGKRCAEALADFVKDGGILLIDGKFGVVDEESMLNKPLPGGEFNEFIGHTYLDTDYENLSFKLDGRPFCGYYGREITELNGARALAHFPDGTPAVVENEVRLGKVITLNTCLFYGYSKGHPDAAALCEMLGKEYGLSEITADAPLKVRVADGDGTRYAFVFNYTDRKVSGKVKGLGFDENLSVDANDVIVLTKKI